MSSAIEVRNRYLRVHQRVAFCFTLKRNLRLRIKLAPSGSGVDRRVGRVEGIRKIRGTGRYSICDGPYTEINPHLMWKLWGFIDIELFNGLVPHHLTHHRHSHLSHKGIYVASLLGQYFDQVKSQLQ